ncbi:dephospho-CoA kinase [Hydrogenophilus islandicus]
MKPYLVGLTGGIGSGKSTAAHLFAEAGAGVIDTDAIAHRLTAPGGAAIPAIRDAFGDAVVTAEGALDRAAMRALVFRDATARKRLEAILHPMIRGIVGDEITALAPHHPYLILVVPLLVETGAYQALLDRILVVDCPEALQIARVKARSGLPDEQIAAILAAQAPRAVRLAAANDVIDNSGDLEHLARQVADHHQRYLKLAAGER